MNDLKSILNNLEIRSYEDAEGNHTVVSNSEPAFCFVRKNENELAELVVSTLKSYAKHFHNSEIEVELKTEIVTTPRTVKLEQRTKFLPDFGFGNPGGALCPA